MVKLESMREEMYASNVINASSPGEFEFGFCSPIGLDMGQAESIPPKWADIQKSEFYEEWLNAMRLELDGHFEVGTFSADVVPEGVNVITAKWVFAWKTDSDGYFTKAKARLVARGSGQQLGAKLDTDVYMKLLHGCGERTGKVIRLDRALYGIKQAGRLWSAVLCQTLVVEHCMEQEDCGMCGEADSCSTRTRRRYYSQWEEGSV